MLVAAVRVHDPDVIAAVVSDLAAVRRPVRNLPLRRRVEGQLSRTATVSVDRPDLAVPDEDDLASVWRPGREDVCRIPSGVGWTWALASGLAVNRGGLADGAHRMIRERRHDPAHALPPRLCPRRIPRRSHSCPPPLRRS